MSQEFSFQSQKMKYVHENKTAFTRIHEPFMTAGKQLGWDEHVPGIGLNEHIIDFVLKTGCYLVVSVTKSNSSYWISADKLKDFIKKNNCDYTISGVKLKVISWKKFIRLEEHISL